MMKFRHILGVAVVFVMACAPAPSQTVVVTPTTTPTPTATVVSATTTPTPTPTPVATSSSWASVCGTVSDFVANTSTTNGSLVLNSPGRPPLKITLTSPKSTPGGQMAGYICASLDAGSPNPIFSGLWPPNTGGFVMEGTLPATKADPSPTGFVVPQSCAYVVPPVVGANQSVWKVDCGATTNRDARVTLGPAFAQQGWTLCGAVTATAIWAKGTLEMVVAESSGSPGDYPTFTQHGRTNACP